MIVNLTDKMTDAEIEDAMKDMCPVCQATQTGFFICIDGYENDRRELWEIPEVASFFGRLVNSGFIAFLEVSVTEGLTRLGKEITSLGYPGLGALEVWMIAKKLMHAGSTDIERKEMIKFIDDLEVANAKSRIVVSKPKRGNKPSLDTYTLTLKTKLTCSVKDGQQKFRGSKWNTK